MALPSAVIPILDAATVIHEKPVSTLDTVVQTPLPNGVRIVAPHEYKQAAACLAESFVSDSIVRYCVDTPDRMHLSEEERYALHQDALEYVTYAHCLQGLVLTIGDFDCVALWLPPGKNIDDWWTILRSGMWRLNYKFSKEGKIRFFEEFLPLLATTKLEVLGERDNCSWYLNYVGTKPAARGRGHAKKLIQYVTGLADTQGLPCYLESSHDVNLIIYGKMGFEPKKKIYLERAAGKELCMDVMVREPVVPTEEDTSNVVASKLE